MVPAELEEAGGDYKETWGMEEYGNLITFLRAGEAYWSPYSGFAVAVCTTAAGMPASWHRL